MIVIKKKVNFLLILQRAEFLLLLILRTTWFGELFWIFFLHVLIIYIFYLVSVAIYIFKKKIFINNNLAITTLLVINCFNLLFQFSLLLNFSSPFKNLSTSDKSLKIMSVNLRLENDKYEAINNLIQVENADILVLIELNSQIFSKIKGVINEEYPYKSKISTFYGYNQIFSKYPIIVSADVPATESNIGYIKAEIAFTDKTYRIYAVHSNPPLTPELFYLRNQYLITLARDIYQEQSGNLIVVGDFNVSPWSYYYQKFLKDSDYKIRNLSLSNGIIFTWYLNPPVLASQLDHIFVGQNLIDYNFKTRYLEGSDHGAL